MRTLVVSGFGPFGPHADNPSARLARRAVAQPVADGWLVVAVVFPVAYGAVDELLADTIERHRPDVWLALGLDAHARGWKLERFAVNVDDAGPDEAGEERRGRSIRPGGAEAYRSTLPLERLQEALQSAGFPVGASNHAGAFLCNHLFYRVRELGTIAGPPGVAGFIHVPPESVMPAGEQERALGVALSVLTTAAPPAPGDGWAI